MGFWRILPIALGHLLLVIASAVAAEGWDLDQLRSRSLLAEVAGIFHDVLMYPHDALLRALPSGWLVRNAHMIPVALLLNSILWGVALHVSWRAIQRLRHRAPAERSA